jgi:ribonuclease HI
MSHNLCRHLNEQVRRRQVVEFTSVKEDSGILLNESADMLATRGRGGDQRGIGILVPMTEATDHGDYELAGTASHRWRI